MKDIDIEAFQKDILNSSLYTAPAKDINEFVVQYNTVLKEIFDNHAPEKTKKVPLCSRAPWYKDEIWEAKRMR